MGIGGGDDDDDDDTDDPVDPPGITGRQLFDRDVYPPLDDKCGSSGCHAESETLNGPFVDDVASEGYDRAVSQPRLVAGFTAQAPILTKISAGHKGVTFTAAEGTKIAKWLQKEVDERGEVRDLMREWSGCMTFADFETANMAQAWGNAEADGGGRCKTCHALGEYEFLASDQREPFFNNLTKDRTYLSKYFTLDAGNTAVLINNDKLINLGNALPPHTSHPEFDPYGGPKLIALRQLHELTTQRMTADQCDPPRF